METNCGPMNRSLPTERKKRKWEVEVLWDTREKTWEPMENVKRDDKLTLAKYAHDNNLVDTAGWKWARRLIKNPKKFVRMCKIFASQKSMDPVGSLECASQKCQRGA